LGVIGYRIRLIYNTCNRNKISEKFRPESFCNWENSLRRTGQTDMARSTRLVMVVKNIYTLWGRIRLLTALETSDWYYKLIPVTQLSYSANWEWEKDRAIQLAKRLFPRLYTLFADNSFMNGPIWQLAEPNLGCAICSRIYICTKSQLSTYSSFPDLSVHTDRQIDMAKSTRLVMLIINICSLYQGWYF